jgi:hypothetical protein
MAMGGAGAAPRPRSPSPKPASPSVSIDIGDYMLNKLMKNKGFKKTYEAEGDEMDILAAERELFGDDEKAVMRMLRAIFRDMAKGGVSVEDVRRDLLDRYGEHYQFGSIVDSLKALKVVDKRKPKKAAPRPRSPSPEPRQSPGSAIESHIEDILMAFVEKDNLDGEDFGELIDEYGQDDMVDEVVKRMKKDGYTVKQIVKGMKGQKEEGYTMFDDYIEEHS